MHAPAIPSSEAAPRMGRGWVRKTSIWVPTWRGWLLVAACVALAGYGGLRGIHSFLAPNRPVRADVLVVEGWVPDYVLKQGLDLSLKQKSRYLILTGGTVRGEVEPEAGDTYARMAEKRLRRIGGDLEHVRAVPSVEPVRDRTYGSALAIRDWLRAEGLELRAINILTSGPHARRSRLLFQKALGPQVEVGIISIPNREYDARKWWRYSEGVKETLSEGAAYLYARFLFRPDAGNRSR